MKLYTKVTCRQLLNSSWESQAHLQFEEISTGKGKPFPCTLDIAGFNADQLRYQFIEYAPASQETAVSAAATLQSYLPIARGYETDTPSPSKNLGVQHV